MYVRGVKMMGRMWRMQIHSYVGILFSNFGQEIENSCISYIITYGKCSIDHFMVHITACNGHRNNQQGKQKWNLLLNFIFSGRKCWHIISHVTSLCTVDPSWWNARHWGRRNVPGDIEDIEDAPEEVGDVEDAHEEVWDVEEAPEDVGNVCGFLISAEEAVFKLDFSSSFSLSCTVAIPGAWGRGKQVPQVLLAGLEVAEDVPVCHQRAWGCRVFDLLCRLLRCLPEQSETVPSGLEVVREGHLGVEDAMDTCGEQLRHYMSLGTTFFPWM